MYEKLHEHKNIWWNEKTDYGGCKLVHPNGERKIYH